MYLQEAAKSLLPVEEPPLEAQDRQADRGQQCGVSSDKTYGEVSALLRKAEHREQAARASPERGDRTGHGAACP